MRRHALVRHDRLREITLSSFDGGVAFAVDHRFAAVFRPVHGRNTEAVRCHRLEVLHLVRARRADRLFLVIPERGGREVRRLLAGLRVREDPRLDGDNVVRDGFLPQRRLPA